VNGLLAPDWPAPPGVRACSTLRDAAAGVSAAPFDRFNLGTNAGDAPAAVAANREALRTLAGLPAEPRWLQQVHGTRVVRFHAAARAAPGGPAESLGPLEIADAAVTSDAGVVLAILTADCLPVLFCSADGRTVAAAHAGWRGLAGGVLEATVAAMDADHVMAWLGPAAGPARYEVGEEVRAAFVDRDARAAAAFVATRPGHWLVDLPALARRRLAGVGVTRVGGGTECTMADPARFYSYRRDGKTGRMATLVWRQ
jgi:YfiH family protein